MKYRHIGGILPTIFDIPEMWELNSERAGGMFNLIFFWIYPIVIVFFLPITILFLIEKLFTKSANPSIYLVTRTDKKDVRLIYRTAVVCCHTVAEAKRIHPSGNKAFKHVNGKWRIKTSDIKGEKLCDAVLSLWPNDLSKLDVVKIGTAIPGLTGVICSS